MKIHSAIYSYNYNICMTKDKTTNKMFYLLVLARRAGFMERCGNQRIVVRKCGCTRLLVTHRVSGRATVT
jgi:hypothetical protein